MTAAQRLAAALEADHDEVVSASAERDLVRVARKEHPSVDALVVDRTNLNHADLDALAPDGVHAVVVAGWQSTYEWSAREAAQANGIALLTGREFFGALNSRDILDYDLGHVRYFFGRVGEHPKVTDLQRLEPEKVDIVRAGMPALRAFVADIYRLGEADVAEIHGRNPAIDLISNLSAWNQYTPEAADEARRRSIRVFDLSGLWGALYLEGTKFREYIPKTDR